MLLEKKIKTYKLYIFVIYELEINKMLKEFDNFFYHLIKNYVKTKMWKILIHFNNPKKEINMKIFWNTIALIKIINKYH